MLICLFKSPYKHIILKAINNLKKLLKAILIDQGLLLFFHEEKIRENLRSFFPEILFKDKISLSLSQTLLFGCLKNNYIFFGNIKSINDIFLF